MAVTVVANLTSIWDCESVTGAVGNKPALETEIFKEQSNSVDFTTTQTNTNAGFDGTIPTLTSEHVRIWYTSITFPNMASFANGGVRFYADDGTNRAYWYIAGKDTYTGGWLNVVVDLASNPDEGTVTVASISEMGIIHGNGIGSESYATRPKNQINVWVDYFRYGEGLVGYGTSWGIDDVYIEDSTDGVNYGIVEKVPPVYFIYGSLEFGRTTEITTYTDTGVQIDFADANVADDLYGIIYTGNTIKTSTFNFENSVVSTAGKPFYLDMDDSNIGELNFSGNTIRGASTSRFLSSASGVVDSNVFDDCGLIVPKLSEFTNNTISNPSVAVSGGVLLDGDGSSTWSGLNFVSGGTGHGIYISTSGYYDLEDFTYTGYGSTGTTNAAVNNDSGGSVVLNVNGGDSPTYYNWAAGSATSIVNAVSLSVKVVDIGGDPIENAQVAIYDSNSTQLMNEDTLSTGFATGSYNYLGTEAVSVRVRKGSATDTPKFIPVNSPQTIGTAGLTVTITLIEDTNNNA